MNNFSNRRIVRALVAIGTSVFTGAAAGAALARKPLLVPVDRPRRGMIVRS